MDITERRITKIAREASKFIVRTLRADGVGTGEFDIIHAVRHNPGTTQSELCRLLGTDKGAVARQIANLEAKGYLTRSANPKDGRSRLIYPTQKAENLKNSKAHMETLFYSWLLEPLDEADRLEFTRILGILYQRSKVESRAGFPILNALAAEGGLDK